MEFRQPSARYFQVAGIALFSHELRQFLNGHLGTAPVPISNCNPKFGAVPKFRRDSRDRIDANREDICSQQSIQQRRFAAAHSSEEGQLEVVVFETSRQCVDAWSKLHQTVSRDDPFEQL